MCKCIKTVGILALLFTFSFNCYYINLIRQVAAPAILQYDYASISIVGPTMNRQTHTRTVVQVCCKY